MFIKSINGYRAKINKNLKKKGQKSVEKKNSGNSEKREKSDGKFAPVFSGFFGDFRILQKHRKSTITAQNTPFLEKPENADFGDFGKFREIPGNFLPEFSRREFFSTNFHRNVYKLLYVYKWLQPVNQAYLKVISREFRRDTRREISRKEKFSRQFFREFRGKLGRNFPENLPTQLFHTSLQSGFQKIPENVGKFPGGKFSRREVSRISRNSPVGKFSPQNVITTLLTIYSCIIDCSR